VTYRAPVEDLQFLIGDVLGGRELFALEAFRHADFEVVASVLAEGARLAADVIGPINQPGDRAGARIEGGAVVTAPGFRETYARYVRDGWPGLDMPREYGGQGLPRMLQAAFAEMVNGACLSFGMLPLMCRASAWLLAEHGSAAIATAYAPKLAAGEWGATICISEPQAGSDVGRIQTLAKPADDGSYLLSGSKIFITYGDQDLTEQICHMVLARTPGAPAGTRGISLFLVPKRLITMDGGLGAHNGMRALRLEHKMGLKASPTCVMQYEDCVAYRIGELHRGLSAMFTMVNTMRLEVALQGVAIGGAATHRALQYATERPQGGDPERPPVPISEHPDVRRMLLLMRARIEPLRALLLEIARNLDVAAAAPDAATRAAAAALAEWLLPIGKACGADAGFEVANLAVQIFGGQGYVSDAGVEQYVRDIRVASIYEGTNGIQALDLVTRRLGRDSSKRFDAFASHIRADLNRLAGSAELGQIHAAVRDGLTRLERCTQRMVELNAESPRDAAAGATAYLRLAGLVACGWMWLRMASAARSNTDFARGKRVAAVFFAEQLMPEAALLETQACLGAATLDALAPNASQW
jgi:alkylation response protein AidB-like acyl-CoA dehydrogenase